MAVTTLARPHAWDAPGWARLWRSLRENPLTLLDRCVGAEGLVRLPVPGREVYVTGEPAVLHEALTLTGRAFAKGLPRRGAPTETGFQPLAPLLGQGLLTSEGDLHKRQRRLMQPLFHRERVAGYAETFTRLADEGTAGWRDGEVRDLHRDMVETTLAIVARTLFDVDLGAGLIGTIRRGLDANVGATRPPLLPGSQLLDRLPLPATRRWAQARDELDAALAEVVAEHRGRPGGHDLLSLLLEARDADTGEAMSDLQIRQEALTLMLAGHETTANALSWTWALLAHHPQAQERLADELAALPDRPVGMADLPSLSWTGAVVRESMRLYPPAPSFLRRVVEDREVAGQRVGAGALFILSPYLLHRDARWWASPLSFRPERWLDADPAHVRQAYLPFGAGPRQCIGNTFADAETVLVLATQARRWRVEPVGPFPAGRLSVTLRPRDEVPLRLRDRTA